MQKKRRQNLVNKFIAKYPKMRSVVNSIMETHNYDKSTMSHVARALEEHFPDLCFSYKNESKKKNVFSSSSKRGGESIA